MIKKYNKVGYVIVSTLICFFLTLLSVNLWTNKANRLFNKNNNKIKIVASLSFIADAIRNIAHDDIELKCLIDGVDPHQYQLTKKDLDYIEEADLIFYSGLNPENKLTRLLQGKTLFNKSIDITSEIPENMLIETSKGELKTSYDPHVWFDIDIWKLVTKTIKNKLIYFDNKNKNYYNENFEKYINKLGELSFYIKDKISKIPFKKRKVVTTHNAFNYFSKYLNIEMKSVQGLNSDIDAGAYELNSIVHYIYDNDIKYIFPENVTPYKLLEAVREGVIYKGKNIEIAKEIYADSLGIKGTEMDNYIGMYKYNVDNLYNYLI